MAMTQTALHTLHWTARYMVVMCALLSLLPVIETDTWWTRCLDFVRVQLLIALVVMLLLYPVLGRPSGLLGGMTLGLACLAIDTNSIRFIRAFHSGRKMP
jgi:hypothetical protein